MENYQQMDTSALTLKYQRMKLSNERFNVNPQELTKNEQRYVDDLAAKTVTIQQRICASDEAVPIHIDEQAINEAMAMLVEQCGDIYQFQLTLQKHQLSEKEMREVLKTELLCEAVLDAVSQDLPPLLEQDAKDYYRRNIEKFSRARTWKVSQILITINDDFAENGFVEAKRRANDLYQTLSVDNFSQSALRHSECPSAMEGGNLGWCEQGKLFPEIESVLQWLPKQCVSAPIQSEIGFHIIVCHDEKPQRTATFKEAYESIEELHTKRARQYVQKQWLQSLTPRT
ncbi:peptidylprolyl isomerase [Vibrio agarivorans]|uniref:peptidylprolyl isomerase n=1 Tax=Vibrio agarivorans TaxID=153622 RepID=UPI00222F638E|nr:peptidylprolyl isomerase [Vibrio agarivorans]